MPSAFVVAVRGAGFEDFAVAGFEEAENIGFVNYTGFAVAGEGLV